MIFVVNLFKTRMLSPLRHVLHRRSGPGTDSDGQLSLCLPASSQDVVPGHDQVQARPGQEEGQGEGEECREQEEQVGFILNEQ